MMVQQFFMILMTTLFGQHRVLNYGKIGNQLQIIFLVVVDLANLII